MSSYAATAPFEGLIFHPDPVTKAHKAAGFWHGDEIGLTLASSVSPDDAFQTLTVLHSNWEDWNRRAIEKADMIASLKLEAVSTYEGGYFELEYWASKPNEGMLIVVGTLAEGIEAAEVVG